MWKASWISARLASIVRTAYLTSPAKAMRTLTLAAASSRCGGCALCHRQPPELGALGKQDPSDEWHYQAYKEVLKFAWTDGIQPIRRSPV
eukprot:467299-Amphidinium_carterae.1